MDCKAILMISMVFGAVHCEKEEILFDSTTETKLAWDSYQGATGQGWMEKDYKKGDAWTRVYTVCDVDHANVENWVTSPSFDTKGADALWIKVSYAVRRCNNEDGCHFDINSYETDSVLAIPIYDPWEKVITVNTSKSESDTSIESGEITLPVPIKTKGNKIAIGFRDYGLGCTTITSLITYVKVCKSFKMALIVFPEKSVLESDREVKGECVQNAKVKSEPLSICNMDGEWKNTTGECECKDNFELKNDDACIAVSAATELGSIIMVPIVTLLMVFTRP